MQTVGTVKYLNETKGNSFLNENQLTPQSEFVDLKEINRQIKLSLSIRNGELTFIPGNVLKGLIANILEKYYAFFAHGNSVFEDPEKFKSWLKKPNGALGGKIPVSLLGTKDGINQVDKILGRIEHGIFS